MIPTSGAGGAPQSSRGLVRRHTWPSATACAVRGRHAIHAQRFGTALSSDSAHERRVRVHIVDDDREVHRFGLHVVLLVRIGARGSLPRWVRVRKAHCGARGLCASCCASFVSLSLTMEQNSARALSSRPFTDGSICKYAVHRLTNTSSNVAQIATRWSRKPANSSYSSLALLMISPS
jgi:hypothetical protein